MRKIPPADYRPEYLDRQVIFDVELPDGAAHGPVIDRLELARLRLAFGDDDKGHRTRAQQDAAWEDLPGVEILTRQAATPDGQGGWLIVPEEAAAAIRKGEPPKEETE